jgi:hypothetical protein
MFNIPFIDSNRYKITAISIWLLSFLVLSNTQHVINFTYIFLLLPTLLTIKLSELKKYVTNRNVLLLIALLTITIAAAVHSGKPISQTKYAMVIFLFYLTVFRMPEIKTTDENYFAWSWFLALVAYTLLNLSISWRTGTWHYGERLVMFTSYINNPIYVTNLLTVGLAMISFTSIKDKQFVRLCIAHVITLFLGLIILQSRSMLPAWLVISLLSLWMVIRTEKNYTLPQNIFWLIVPSSILAYILISDIGSHILARGDSYRFEIWQGYIKETIKCGVIFGCGMDDNIQYIAKDGIPMAHAHNIFIANFAKTGLLGSIPLCFLIGASLFYGLKRNLMAGWFLLAGVTALLFDGSSLIKSPNEKWILVHLPIAYLIKLNLDERFAPNPDIN